jgi:hydrogenase maturation protease
VGLRVFDQLSSLEISPEVEVIDGGLCGLDLLRSVEGRSQVVFADAITGLAQAGEIVQLSGEQVAAYAGAYGHAAGLPYLLKMLPQVCCAPLPKIDLLGTPGPADDATISLLAQRCLDLVAHETF